MVFESLRRFAGAAGHGSPPNASMRILLPSTVYNGEVAFRTEVAVHDLVIRNGKVVDGTGRDAFRADVAIDGEIVSAVGEVQGSAWQTIEADGLIVTPGFIDPHTHLDAQLMWDPLGTPACWHGTTTVVIGNCGVSFAPLRPSDSELLAGVLESVEEIPAASMLASLTFRWESYADYLGALDAHPLGVNVGGLVGHAAMRFFAMGEASLERDRIPSERELAEMQHVVAEAMDAGALGFSTSRTASHATPEGIPIPGTWAPEAELVAITKAMGGRGLVQWVAGFGERDANDEYPEVRREIASMGAVNRESGRPVVASVFTHPLVPKLHGRVLQWLDEERDAGADLRPMFNPRTGTSLVGLHNKSPLRARGWKRLYELPILERLPFLRSEKGRRALLEVSPEADERAGRGHHLFGPDRCEYERRSSRRLDAVAQENAERPAETIVRLLHETNGKQLFASGGANQVPEHIEEVFRHPGTLIGLGDAGAHVTSICDSSMTTHALTYWCRERGALTLEETIRRLTSEPAEAFGIPRRGRLTPGAFADVNAIDFESLEMEVPEFVTDFPAAAGRWTQRARGYEHTIVNGQIVIEGGRHTGRLPGRLVRGAGRG